MKDSDDTSDSTPVLMAFKILLVYALSVQWSISTYDITTAFLHATHDPHAERLYVWPPEEYFPLKTVMWKLRRAIYGLRAATSMGRLLRGRT